MEPLASAQMKAPSTIGGTKRAANIVGGGHVASPKAPEENKVAAPALPATSTKTNGITARTLPDGSYNQTSESGMKVSTFEFDQEISLPTGEQFRWNDEGVTAVNGEQPVKAELTATEDGLPLITFKDENRNTVRVLPDSLTYEVLNKAENLAQVFLPDGHQEVVAFGRFKGPDGKVSEYEHHAVYSPSGEVVNAEGFQGLEVEGRKLSFQLENGVRTDRTLARPLPGQAPFEKAPVTESREPSSGLAPLTLFDDQATMLSEPFLTTAESTGTASQASAKLADPKPFEGLPDLSTDFFAQVEDPSRSVEFEEKDSKVIFRDEEGSRAVLLPNGDSFRTDGVNLEVLGEAPTAKNARLVEEGDQRLLAYTDKSGNHYQVDIAKGDYEVSNRQGTLTQGFKADGSTDYTVRGTYTTESGKPEQYQHRATVGAEGQLLSKEGFDDLKVSGNSMKFTLPNGEATSRKLIEGTEHSLDVPPKLELTGAVADEYGGALAFAQQFLGVSTPQPVTASAPMADGIAPANPPPSQTPSGMSRVPLTDGSGTETIMPNGFSVFDKDEAFALSPDGRRFDVTKSPYSNDKGEFNLLSFQDTDGTGYTVNSEDLKLIVQSRDGKVHQLVSEEGKVLTAIRDGENKHLMETNPWNGKSVGSPGTRFDPRFPDRVFVDGSPVGGYEVPHHLSPPGFGGGRGGPDQGPSGVGGPAGFTQQQGMPGMQGFPSMDSMQPFMGGPNGQDYGPGPNGQDYSQMDGSPSYMAGPGQPQQGFQPSFWQRLKGAFTGQNPWQYGARMESGYVPPQANGGQGGASRMGGFPGSYQQYDPMAAQIHQMNQMNNVMMASTMGMSLMNSMSMMFYSPMMF